MIKSKVSQISFYMHQQ